jgi:hypothetical protein
MESCTLTEPSAVIGTTSFGTTCTAVFGAAEQAVRERRATVTASRPLTLVSAEQALRSSHAASM